MKDKNVSSRYLEYINLMIGFFKKLGHFKKRINKRMEGKYSPAIISFSATAMASFLIIMMLFVPNYLGVADDGSISHVMKAVHISYMQTEVSDIYNNYFVKHYSNLLSDYNQSENYINSQVLLLKAAVRLDNLITKDTFFDIRFLALLYTIFYIPALFLLIKQACMRVKKFSEGFAIGFVGVLIFTDVAYITYFNSFYPEALWFISLMYCVGAGLSFQENREGYLDFIYLMILSAAGCILISSRQQTAFLGVIFAVFVMKLLFVRRGWKWATICVLTSFAISIFSIGCMIHLQSDFNETSKFHAMTRGVLFQSSNPGESLKEFGIEPSYEMLTDASSYDYLPLVQASNPVLRKDFLDKYTQLDIVMYYLRHPASYISMLDVSIKSCFGIRREFCGNYEKSVGLPPKAKSIFWSMWSIFKNNTAPKTIGYLVLLVIVILFLFRKNYSLRPSEDRRSTVFMDVMLVVVCICLMQGGITITNSGDAEMIQHCFLISYGIDMMTYFIFAEVAHKINIF